MQKNKSEMFDKELWYRISIHRGTLITIVVFICLIISSLIAYHYRGIIMELVNRGRAEKVIERAQSKLANAESIEIPERELKSYRMRIKEAKRLYELNEYSRSLHHANIALKGLLDLITNTIHQQESIALAVFAYVEGKVEFRKPDSKEWLVAEAGETVPPGTRVRTYRNTKAEITIGKDRITLRQNSYIILSELGPRRGKRVSKSVIRVEKHAELEAKVRPEKEGDSFSVVQDETQVTANKAVDLEYKGAGKFRDVTVYKGNAEIIHKNQKIKLNENEAVSFEEGGRIAIPEKLIYPPILLAPANVSLIKMESSKPASVKLRWTKVKEAKQYIVEIANDTHFQKVVLGKVIDGLNYKLDNLGEGTYFWHIASLSKNNRRSKFSDFWSFRVFSGEHTGFQFPDAKPPKLKITDVRQHDYLVEIKGETDPGVTLLINDEKKMVNPDGTFTAFCNWEETMIIDVFDFYGNHVSKSLSIQLQR